MARSPFQALAMAVDGWQRRGDETKPVSVYETRYVVQAYPNEEDRRCS
jgi:hypothetical protein